MAARRAFEDAEELVLRRFDEAAQEGGWNPSALVLYRERLALACRLYRSLLDGNEVGSGAEVPPRVGEVPPRAAEVPLRGAASRDEGADAREDEGLEGEQDSSRRPPSETRDDDGSEDSAAACVCL